MSQVKKLLSAAPDLFTQEELFKLGVELSMGNFINSYVETVGGNIDEAEDVETAMSLWFKASNDVKVAQLARLESTNKDSDEDEDEDAESDDDQDEEAAA